ncbi:MAG: CBS domain-containing protein [Rhodothermales bacterium]
MKTSVAEILKRKGDRVITIDRSTTVFKTIGRMVEHNVGSIVVVDGGTVLGIFTERDYLRRIALEGRSSKTTRVEEVMTPDVLCVSPNETVEECLAIMTEKKCRHLPVLRDGQLAGVISIGDCVRELSERAEWRVESLERYVTGQYPG